MSLQSQAPKPIDIPDNSIKSVDGYNLSEFCLSPAAQNTKQYANGTKRFDWIQKVAGIENEFFFQIDYGKTPPNGFTEDLLLLMIHLMHEQGTHENIKTNVHRLKKIQGYKHKPSKRSSQEMVRHMESLFQLAITTNFIYDREEKQWGDSVLRQRVLSEYIYEGSGIERVRKLKRGIKNEAGETIDVELITNKEKLMSLKEFSFTKSFSTTFLKDTVTIDLATYFSLERIIPKRMYRYGNRYVKTFGGHSLDLHQFLVSRIGLSERSIDAHKYFSGFVGSKVKPHVERVNLTEDMLVRVEKSQTPSGYIISFNKPSKQLFFAGFTAGFNKTEKRAFKLLCDNQIYQQVAKGLVNKYRKKFGKEAYDYIRFVVREFNKKVKDGSIRTQEKYRGGALKKWFDNDWLYPHYNEYVAEKTKQVEKKEYEMFERSGSLNHIGDVLGLQTKAVHATNDSSVSKNFSFEMFKEEYPQVFRQILSYRTRIYEKGKQELGEDIITFNGKKTMEELIADATESDCKRYYNEANKGAGAAEAFLEDLIKNN